MPKRRLRLIATGQTLAALHPALAAEWDLTLNEGLTPHQVTPGSSRPVWWRCSKDPRHAWRARIYSRTALGSGCAACLGRLTIGAATLASDHPEIAEEWHPSRNGDLTPAAVVPRADLRIWWRCAGDPSHEWQATVLQRVRSGSGCPVCRKARFWALD